MLFSVLCSYSTMHKCWMKAPADRPTFSDLVQLLHDALLTIDKHRSDHELGGKIIFWNKRSSSVDNVDGNGVEDDDDTQF